MLLRSRLKADAPTDQEMSSPSSSSSSSPISSVELVSDSQPDAAFIFKLPVVGDAAPLANVYRPSRHKPKRSLSAQDISRLITNESSESTNLSLRTQGTAGAFVYKLYRHVPLTVLHLSPKFVLQYAP